MSDEEKAARDEVLRLARSTSGNDSISIQKVLTSDRYSVGIELDKALANPGGPDDLVLKDGDALVYPKWLTLSKFRATFFTPIR